MTGTILNRVLWISAAVVLVYAMWPGIKVEIRGIPSWVCWKLRHPCWCPRWGRRVGWMWSCPCGKVFSTGPDRGLGTEYSR